MNNDRRDFIKTLTVIVSGLLGSSSLKAREINEEEELHGILIDTTLCVGCQTCEWVCAEENSLPEPNDYPEIGLERKLDPTRFTVVNGFDTSNGEVYVKKQCMHCNQPACDAACLTEAMKKMEKGPVVWRENKCMGCRFCMISCPFEIPKFEYHSNVPKIQKCSMCWERQKDGLIPACVENCPADALMFGKRRDLLDEAFSRIYTNPDQYYPYVYGEDEAGGTGVMYLASVPFEEIGFNTTIQKGSYPALTKGFLYSVPSVFILWPMILLAIYESTKNNNDSEEEEL